MEGEGDRAYRRLRGRTLVGLPLLLVGLMFGVLMALDAWLEGALGNAWLLIGEHAVYWVVPAIFAVRAGIDWRELLGARAGVLREWRWVPLTAWLLAAGLGAFWLFYAPLSFVAPALVENWALADPFLYVRGEFAANAITFVALVVLAPIGEELVFRGLLLRAWTARHGAAYAIGASSLLFAIFHVDVLGAFVFGAVLCLLARATGGLWVPIAVHALNNLVACAIEAAWVEGDWPVTTDVAAFRAQWPWAIAAGLAGAAGLWALRRYWLAPSEAKNADAGRAPAQSP